MAVTLVAVCAVALSLLVWSKRRRDIHQMQRHSITPEALYALLASHRDVLVFDVREPLDVLVESEIIPGAIRLAPREVRDNPSLMQKKKIRWCTVPAQAIRPVEPSCIERSPWALCESNF